MLRETYPEILTEIIKVLHDFYDFDSLFTHFTDD